MNSTIIPSNSFSRLSEDDLYLFNEGSHFRLYDKLGAHQSEMNGVRGTDFAVWAPNAFRVSVIGDFNHWTPGAHPLSSRGDSGIWEGFVPNVGHGTLYKFHISSRQNGQAFEKSDPFGFFSEVPPKTASIVWDLHYSWKDQSWMKERAAKNSLSAPMSVYEIHLGSWKHVIEARSRSFSYRELAPEISAYVKKMGFTHVELMPIMEHPFYASWGYQVTGYFAPTSRFGTPQDFMYFVDYLHQQGIGVILDWVPSHFPTDAHGLGQFDGTALFEHADPKKGFHPDWNSLIFNYGRHEVQSFLISSAHFWLDKYHIDGLRVDGVASMLYLDYSRKAGEWIPNKYGGHENLEAISFLRRFNEETYKSFPDVQTIAEESTSWPMVSRPVYVGGLGFGLKWDMGWMHDTLRYFSRDPIHRPYHHSELTFRMLYAFNENFVLSLSHDEVVHGKASLIEKMPGDYWQKWANWRLLFGYLYASSGKKLVFMGNEFGQWREWNHDVSLDWHLLDLPAHRQGQQWVADLNRVYKENPALWQHDFDPSGFEWLDCTDVQQSVISFYRKGDEEAQQLLCVFNFTPVPRDGYTLGVPRAGFWEEVLNSDAEVYGGSGKGNLGGVWSSDQPAHGRPNSIQLNLPPLGMLLLRRKP